MLVLVVGLFLVVIIRCMIGVVEGLKCSSIGVFVFSGRFSVFILLCIFRLVWFMLVF